MCQVKMKIVYVKLNGKCWTQGRGMEEKYQWDVFDIAFIVLVIFLAINCHYNKEQEREIKIINIRSRQISTPSGTL